jgi:hypothetical protein
LRQASQTTDRALGQSRLLLTHSQEAPVRSVLPLAILVAAAVPCAAAPGARVRGASPTETRLIQDLLARSDTARALAAEIDATDLIVYVQLTGDQAAGRGATRLVTAGPLYRYLRIVVGAMTHPKDRGPLLAHELQHAVEIGRAPEVRDEEGLRQLYWRIGEDSRAQFAFETSAAREIGVRVLREMMGLASRGPVKSSGRP